MTVFCSVPVSILQIVSRETIFLTVSGVDNRCFEIAYLSTSDYA